jgi:hypothetical protein
MESIPVTFQWKQTIYIVIDPAAGGPQSDFAFISFYRYKGVITVKKHIYERLYSIFKSKAAGYKNGEHKYFLMRLHKRKLPL